MREKLDMKTINFIDENIAKIAQMFPNVVTESKDGLLMHTRIGFQTGLKIRF
jgi:hypothetical protein